MGMTGRPFNLEIGEYDPLNDVIEIEGTRYSGVLFRELGFNTMVGQVLRVVKKRDGIVTVERITDKE